MELMISKKSVEIIIQATSNLLQSGDLDNMIDVEFTEGVKSAANCLIKAAIQIQEEKDEIYWFRKSTMEFLLRDTEKKIKEADNNHYKSYLAGMKYFLETIIEQCSMEE